MKGMSILCIICILVLLVGCSRVYNKPLARPQLSEPSSPSKQVPAIPEAAEPTVNDSVVNPPSTERPTERNLQTADDTFDAIFEEVDQLP